MTPTIDTVRQMLEALNKARHEFDGLPHSLGYEFTHIPQIDEAMAAGISLLEQMGRAEPVDKMFQVIGMNVLKAQKYQDGYYIASGDEDRICKMFYDHLRYHFGPAQDAADAALSTMLEGAISYADNFGNGNISTKICRKLIDASKNENSDET